MIFIIHCIEISILLFALTIAAFFFFYWFFFHSKETVKMLIKEMRCDHEFETNRNFYGEEIIYYGHSTELKCVKCPKLRYVN